MYAAGLGIVHIYLAIFGVVGDIGGARTVAWEKRVEVGRLGSILLAAEVASTEEKNDIKDKEIASFRVVGDVDSIKEEKDGIARANRDGFV